MHIERLSIDEHREAARALGIKRYPALVANDRVLSALFLTKRKIRRFLESL